MPVLDAGRFDREIVIQQSTPTQDALGTPIDSWATLATVWAQKIDRPGREYFTSDQRIAENMTIFRIRYLSTVTNKMRISYNSQIYNIQSINELGRGETLELITRLEAP